MELKNNSIKKYQVSKMEMMLLWLKNYEFGDPLNGSIDFVKFHTIDKFADFFVHSHNRNDESNQEFRFTLIIEPEEEEELKKYLLTQKDFVIHYIVSTGYFTGSHLYQLYLQYLPNELTEVEKNILLDGYISMMTDLRGSNYTLHKRKCLEQRLNITRD